MAGESNDQELDTVGSVTDLGRHGGAIVQRREPPGESFPPYNPLVGADDPDSAFARFCREQSGLASDMRSYLGILAQRSAPQNEQIYQNGGLLVNAGALDLDLGQIPLNLTARVHRIVVEGTLADVPTLTLYNDGAGALGSALGTWNLGALNADGVAMVEPRDLNFPKGRRVVARLRAGVSVNPIYVKVFTRSYPA